MELAESRPAAGGCAPPAHVDEDLGDPAPLSSMQDAACCTIALRITPKSTQHPTTASLTGPSAYPQALYQTYPDERRAFSAPRVLLSSVGQPRQRCSVAQPAHEHPAEACMVCSLLSATRPLQGSANKLASSPTSKGGCPETCTLQHSCCFKNKLAGRTGTWPEALHRREACAVRAASAGRIRKGAARCDLPLAKQHLRNSRQAFKANSVAERYKSSARASALVPGA